MYNRYLQTAKQLISFPSISTDPAFAPHIHKTVTWLQNHLTSLGFKVQVITGYGNPIIIARYHHQDSLPTYFVYGHYDVQPASQEDGWDQDPFTLVAKNNRLYGRGIVDNKGQFLIHLTAIADLIATHRLTKNILFVIEGNEETGGDHLSHLMADQPQLFQADEYLISDGEMPYKPVLTASFRGTFNLTLTITTAATNLHSGLYGGAVPSATVEAGKFLAAIYDTHYNLQIPGLTTHDQPPTKQELTNCQLMDKEKDKAGTLAHTGVRQFTLQPYSSFSAKVGFTTSLTPSGLASGYHQQGYANIAPNQAILKFNFRLAPNQTVAQALTAFRRFLKTYSSQNPYASFTITNIDSQVDPIKIDLSSPAHQTTIRLLEKVYRQPVLIDYCGATLPVVVDIKRLFGKDPILVSLANDDCNMHGVNENFHIDLIKKGLTFSSRLFAQ